MNGDGYRLLSRVFHMPDLEFTGYLRSSFSADIRCLPADCQEGFRQFLDEHAEMDVRQLYEMLAVEYTRLFVNSVQGLPCPPFESIYRENVVMGASTIAVLRKYQEAGLEVLEDFPGLPDHVAVELEFLHYVAAKGDAARHDAFLREHLSQWVYPFSQAVARHAAVDFYRHAAAALAAAVADSLMGVAGAAAARNATPIHCA